MRPDPLPALRLVTAGTTDPTVPPERPGASTHDLWISPVDHVWSLAIDRDGGVPLFELDEEEATELLRHWWRHHRARYLEHEEAERRRARVRSVLPKDDEA